jgi:predicted permease
MFDSLKADVSTTLRAWGRRPLPIIGAVFTLAVAVGVNLAMVGLVDRALLGAPAFVKDAGRVFTLGFGTPGESRGLMTTAPYPTFKAIQDETRAIGGSAGAFQRLSTHLAIDGDQRPIEAMLVSSNYLDVLGARPLIGRGFVAEEDRSGSSPSIIVSESLWRSALNADPQALGRPLTVGGLEYTLSGVMPRGFSGHTTAQVDAWVPFAAALRNTPGWEGNAFRNVTGVVARLPPGTGTAAAEGRISSALDRRSALRPLGGADVAENDRRVAWWLYGVSMLVLVIGLANTATLLVVRGAQSRRDLSIRAALGATRGRLARRAMIEAAALAIAATFVSLMLASWIDDVVRVALFPSLIPSSGNNLTAWGATLVVLGLAMLVAALAMSSQIPRDAGTLRAGSGSNGPARQPMLTRGLLVTQTTFAVLLLAGAGLVGTSLRNLWAQDFGMSMGDVLIVDFEQTAAHIADQDQFFGHALDRVRALPGVTAVTPIDAIPFSGFNVPPIAIPGLAQPPGADRQLPYLTAATPAFLKILGITVVAGRTFTPEDDRGAPVVLVNESLARAAWPGQSALGKCIRIGFDQDFNPETFDHSSGPPMPSAAVPCREVVGVTRDVRQRSLLPGGGEDRLMQYFVPFAQVPVPPFAGDPVRIRGLMVQTNRDDASVARTIRQTTLAGRTDLPFLRVRPYTSLLERQVRPWVAGTRLLGLFSALAVGVAAIGLYAAFAHAVAERRREMAIRMAIGAERRSVVAMVLREALRIAGVGAVVGCLLTIALSRVATSLLFGTTASNPIVLGASATLMLLVAAVATLSPARLASRSDPSVLLRSE